MSARSLGVLFVICGALFAAQLLADINHLSQVSYRLNDLHYRKLKRDLPRRDMPSEIERRTWEANDFMQQAFEEEHTFSMFRIPIDGAWLLIILISGVSGLVQWRNWRRFATVSASLALILGLGAAILGFLSGITDGYLNLAVWPLGVATLFLSRTASSLGDHIWGPILVMLIWGCSLLGLIRAVHSPGDRL